MKYFFSLLLVVLGVFMGQAQKDVVKWDAEIVHVEGDSYAVVLTANIDKNWCIYSQNLDDGGPIPTEFEFAENADYKIAGNTIESEENRQEVMDDMFSMNVIKYKSKAVFTQAVTATGDLESIDGTITYMTCDDSRCLPPKTIDFTAVKRQ